LPQGLSKIWYTDLESRVKMPLRFTFRQLEYFVAVGEEGSIAQASEKVNISSPSISSSISQLEDELGLKLFVRKHAYGLTLTQGGQRFLERAKTVLKDVHALNDLANEITGQIRGPLNIGCLLTFAQLVIPQLRREFETEYPEVEIKQAVIHQADIFDQLRRAKIDVALTYDLAIPADLEFIPLLNLPPYVVLSEAHPLSAKKEIPLDDLQDHPMVLLDLPYSGEYFVSLFTKVGIQPTIAERASDMAIMRSLVANDFGYSLVNIRPLSDLSPDGKKLKFVPVAGKPQAMTVGLLTTAQAQDLVVIRSFVEHCKNSIQKGTLPGLH
tara:strand:+ start:412 stop:1389 length:978 start_codon:yes stop_codon:yes gene_type:complete